MDIDLIDMMLTSQIAQLNCDDNKIQKNQKLKQILFTLQEICVTPEQLSTAFTKLNAHALENANFALKVARFVSSDIFATFDARGDRLRKLMLREIQRNSEYAVVWLISDTEKFYNSLTLLGEFYHKARLLDDQPVECLAPQIIYYLNSLIQIRTVRASKQLLTQLILNGKSLISSHSFFVKNLMIQVRKVLMEATSRAVSVWLMLAVDFQFNNFHPINKRLQLFYADVIGKIEGKFIYYVEDLGEGELISI